MREKENKKERPSACPQKPYSRPGKRRSIHRKKEVASSKTGRARNFTNLIEHSHTVLGRGKVVKKQAAISTDDTITHRAAKDTKIVLLLE